MIDGEVRFKDYLLRIGDLINIEGPLLTLFSDVRNEHLYLYDWVDSDDSANRFLIYRIAVEAVLDYINKKITHRELFSRAIDGRYYVADIRPAEMSTYKIFRLTQLPGEYDDIETNLFDAQFSRDAEKILLFVTRAQAKNSNDFTELATGYVIGHMSGAGEAFGHLVREEARFSNLVRYSLQGATLGTTTAGRFRTPSHARKNYLVDENLEIPYVREDNRLPERERMELYREQGARIDQL